MFNRLHHISMKNIIKILTNLDPKDGKLNVKICLDLHLQDSGVAQEHVLEDI